jgi:uncharacterized protein (TIGR03435 family)
LPLAGKQDRLSYLYDPNGFACDTIRNIVMIGLKPLAIFIGIISASVGWAQTSAFEVASIKPNVSGSETFAMSPISHGSFSATNVTLIRLITTAYRLQNAQVIGGPSWLTSARYDVAAKGAENATTAEVLSMLQPLLADRFNLTIHRETRDLPIYALVTAKNGPKLGKPEDGSCGEASKASKPCTSLAEFKNGMAADNVSLPTIASTLGSILGDRPVVDRTGLTGRFDIHLLWTDGSRRPADSQEESNLAAPGSVFVALQEQAGLKLEATKGPVEVLVIDRVERPSEN